MPVSGNGWPVSPNPEDLDLTPLVVGGVPFSPGVRGGKVHQVLSYVANAVHNRVQKANSTYGCWGYSYRENVNSPGTWSNHASGTAIDYNATLHANGSPTTSNWTAVQIAEIHKILDEVDSAAGVAGVVRWGGDYISTPDAMHFEINVPPDQLGENLVVPSAHSVLPIGAPTLAVPVMPYLTEMSVSYPTLARYSSVDAAPGYANWLFTPTKTGRISIDAMLSHYTDNKIEADAPDGPPVTLYLYNASFNAATGTWVEAGLVTSSNSFFGGFLGYPARDQGRILASVTADQTYIVRTFANPEYPYIRTVVRIGDYAPDPVWIQPPDQEHVYGHIAGNRPPSTPFSIAAMRCQFKTHFDGGVSNVLTAHVGFEGQASASRSFGGPPPGEDPASHECTWHHARRFHLSGDFYWSAFNTGTWNGTDPYDPLVEGYGNCPIFSAADVDSEQHFVELPVGYHYVSQDPATIWGYSSQYWRAFCTSTVLYPTKIAENAKRNGVGAEVDWHGNPGTEVDYLPPLLPTEWLEWESEESELVGLERSWDEWDNGGQYAGTVVCKWYMGDRADEDFYPGRWGPTGDNWWGQTAGDGPVSWTGSQTHLGDKTSGYGGWVPVPPQFWTSIEGIRFTCIPDHLLTDALPPMPGYLTGTGIDLYHFRANQYMAVRAMVRPARYRVYEDPGIEDLDWAGVNAIDIVFDDGGKVLY